MVASRRLPKLSLALLLIAYINLGKFLSAFPSPLLPWSIAIASILSLAGLLTLSWSGESGLITRSLRSDTATFTVIIVLSSLISVVLLWWNVFLYVLLIVAAEILARIDLQAAYCKSAKTFWILSLTSCLGLGLGWIINFLITIL
ncbi:MAG TPA: hypothetical protein V6D29_04625 [Leptolyngbyaceae cyanobacterium]